LLDAIAPGAAVPVSAAGRMGTAEATAEDGDEAFYRSLYPPEYEDRERAAKVAGHAGGGVSNG